MSYVPDRGDLVWLTFDPQAGHEQAGRRPALIPVALARPTITIAGYEQAGRCPALILSPASYNRKVGLALLCPVTNQVKGYPFEVMIPNGLAISGVVLADQVKNLDWQVRSATFSCKLPEHALQEVLQKLKMLLF